jgi:hypothetical protein
MQKGFGFFALVLASFSLSNVAYAQVEVAQPQGPAAAQPASSFSPWSNEPILYPQNEIARIPAARAARAVARERDRQAQFAFLLDVHDRNADFETSPEVLSAKAEVDAAYSALQEARANAVAPLQSDPAYQGIRLEHEEIVRRTNALSRLENPSPAQLSELTQYRLYLARKKAAPERIAAANDPAVSAAQQRLAQATQALQNLRDGRARALRSDPAFVSARQAAWDASAHRRGAEAFYAGSAVAADAALDYAYFTAEARRGVAPVVFSPG